MPDIFRWFIKWHRDHPKDFIGPGVLASLVGGATVVTTYVVIFGWPWMTSTVQTGPRGSGMFVVKSAALREAGDPTAATFYTEAPWVPEGGEDLAGDVYENVQVLGDLTVDNFNRLMLAMTEWVSPEQGCTYCHTDDGNMASDDIYTKVVSRSMIQMNQGINEFWTDHVAPAGVTCYTCHRGENVPTDVWFEVSPVVEAFEGWSANQNRVTANSAYSSLPSDALTAYFLNYEPIRVHDLAPRVENEGTASIQDAERTYALMNYFSNSLDANCTYCHNTRAPFDLEQSTPQLLQSQLGIGLVQDVNEAWILPLADLLPPERLGEVHNDVPKVGCATCHKGYPKPIGGLNVIADWPELAAEGPPVYE